MPSTSKSQQRLFGMVHVCQKKGKCSSPKIKKIAKEIDPQDAEDFASTSHDGLPEKVKSESKYSFYNWFLQRESADASLQAHQNGHGTYSVQTPQNTEIPIDAKQYQRLRQFTCDSKSKQSQSNG
jgi:hypothetical protein